jgi:hypothetical protein
MSYKFLKALTIVLLITWIAPQAQAQCPMCRMSVESNLKNGGSAGKGLNNGILYMLSLPYVLVGTIGYVWWKNRKKEAEESLD